MDLRALPFSAYPGLPPDAEPARCAGPWGSYALPIPANRLLPFALSRPYAGPNSRLNCASIVDATTYEVLFTLNVEDSSAPLYLPTQKVTDGTTEWLLYYGGVLTGLQLPCGRAIRLLFDNSYQSAALKAGVDVGESFIEWYHTGILENVPYGPGTDLFAQRLYLPGTEFTAGESSLNIEEDTDPLTGQVTVTSQTLTFTTAFSIGPVPTRLLTLWQTIAVHRYIVLSSAGLVQKLAVKSSDLGDGIARGCRHQLDLTATQIEVLHVGSGCDRASVALRVEEAPADFSPRRYLCGDTSDTQPDFQRTGLSECEQDGGANWQRTGVSECEQA